MNKKLMAVAVAGALAAPALAFAQASTVQIYGRMEAQYGYLNSQPNFGAAPGTPRVEGDAFNGGTSRIGFRGEESLGRGLSAWFQCETRAKFLEPQVSVGAAICDRNSAVGLKGGFGDMYFGRWTPPIDAASGATLMLNTTGWLGVEQLTMVGTNYDFTGRNSETINYSLPKIGDLSVTAQYTALPLINAVGQGLNTNVAASNANAKPRKMGLGAIYAAGPLVVAAAWQANRNDVANNAASSATFSTDDNAWLVGATYRVGAFKGGITYFDMKEEVSATTKLTRKSMNFAVDYQMTAPGLVRVGYTRANDYEGGAAGSGAGTGADMWQVSYNHSFSKRTVGTLGYARLSNGSAGTYNFNGLKQTTAGTPGQDASVFVLGLAHTF